MRIKSIGARSFNQMPIYLSDSGSAPVFISNASYDPTGPGILLELNHDGIQLSHKTPLKLDAPWKYKYSIHLFRNKFSRENNIFQVHEGSKATPLRVGWMIPISALESDAHDYSQNEHFLNYARAALLGLWMPNKSYSVNPKQAQGILNGGNINLGDIYHDDTTVLVLSRSQVAQIGDFDLRDYIHSFFKYGYLSYGPNSHPATGEGKSCALFSDLGKAIKISKISPHLRNDNFLNTLFNAKFELGAHPLAAFLILYQVFELLMERVFNRQRASLMLEINACISVSQIRDATRIIHETINEQSRLLKLCSVEYMCVMPDFLDLKLACSQFLKDAGRTPGANEMICLYQVRNLVVHEFRSVPAAAESGLAEINSELLVSLTDIVSNYKEVDSD